MENTDLTIDASGWLQGVKHLPSPNCDARPKDTPISLLVIHHISLPPGQFGGDAVQALFLNTLDCNAHPYYQERLQNLHVSSHLFIRRDGSLIQFVPFSKRAWHAGESSFEGVPRCNDYSIGIELEGTDDVPFTEAQYQKLSEVTRMILEKYPDITPLRIVGHSDIAPGRKTDPGPYFDWEKYQRSLS